MKQLVMMRTRGFAGPMFQQCGGNRLIRSSGNAFGAGGALAGVKPSSASVTDATHVTVNYTACADVVTLSDIQVQIDGGAWVAVTAVSGAPGPVHVYTCQTIVAGDVVRIRAAGGALEDCETVPNAIDSWDIPVHNGLVLAGNYILLETGGSDTILLEDAITDESILTEDAP